MGCAGGFALGNAAHQIDCAALGHNLEGTGEQVTAVNKAGFDFGDDQQVVGALRQIGQGHDGQLVHHGFDIFNSLDQLQHSLAVLLGGDFASEQDLPVEAGDIHMHTLTQVVTNACLRTQLNRFIFELSARSASVAGHHGRARYAGNHQRRTSAQGTDQQQATDGFDDKR